MASRRWRKLIVRGLLFALLIVEVPWLLRVAGIVHRRVDDRAGLIPWREQYKFETYLQQMYDESGVDIRFILADEIPGGAIEDFSVREARARGIGRDLDRRGVLFVFDMRKHRLRIEVGPKLEGIFTDAFTGYLMRNHVRSFFAAGDPELGLRVTLFMLHAHLRRAALGQEYDPRAAEYIEDRVRLAMGGGASTAMPREGQEAGFVTVEADAETRRRFGPQPTVEETYRRYLEILRGGRFWTNVDLFTRPSQAFLARFPATPAFTDHVLFLEYGRAHVILVRGDLALLYFTDDPLVSPHFFRRSPAGWQLDLAAELRNTQEYSGGPMTWSLVEQDDDFTRAFIDRYTVMGPFLRVAGGDNRLLPIHTAEVPRFGTLPGAGRPSGVEQLTVTEAAERIATAKGKPVVVMLYSTWDKQTRRSFPEIGAFLRRCQARGAEVLAFSTDENWNALHQLPDFLRRNDAPFPAVHLYRWPAGQLTGAMAPLGIRIGTSWLPPLVALRDREGRVLAQVEGIVSNGPELGVAEIEAALGEITGRPAERAADTDSPSR